MVTVRDGGDMAYPWDSLKSASRRKQVALAFAELKRCKLAHEEYSLPKVARAVFVKMPGGYPTRESLLRYLYDIDITLFV